MRHKYDQHTPKRVISELIIGILMLVCGGFIYLLFRSKSLNIYVWCSVIGLADYIDFMRNATREWNVVNFIRFSLPDGLYCASYIMVMDAIWNERSGIIKCFIISIVPIITIGSEILQYFGIVKGTFDVYDLICYAIPITTYFIIKLIKQKTR